jgi:hypothetical protein
MQPRGAFQRYTDVLLASCCRSAAGLGTSGWGRVLPQMAQTALRQRKRTPTRPSADRRKRSAKGLRDSLRQADTAARKARRKFLRVFPGGFRDEDYLALERDYKSAAHVRWQDTLSEPTFRHLLEQRQFSEIASLAAAIEARTNLLFSFEKMAFRDAVRSPAGSRAFATALYQFLHGTEPLDTRFSGWIEAVDALPRRQTRILTWPLVTVFGFIAQPRTHFFFQTDGDTGSHPALWGGADVRFTA